MQGARTLEHLGQAHICQLGNPSILHWLRMTHGWGDARCAQRQQEEANREKDVTGLDLRHRHNASVG